VKGSASTSEGRVLPKGRPAPTSEFPVPKTKGAAAILEVKVLPNGSVSTVVLIVLPKAGSPKPLERENEVKPKEEVLVLDSVEPKAGIDPKEVLDVLWLSKAGS